MENMSENFVILACSVATFVMIMNAIFIILIYVKVRRLILKAGNIVDISSKKVEHLNNSFFNKIGLLSLIRILLTKK